MVQPEQHVVYAIHEYAIPGSGFLPLKAGDIIHVDEEDGSGWWLGTNLRGQQGVFPSTYTLPYVFPPPSEDLVRDMQLILLGKSFGMDVGSGVPLPLEECCEEDVHDDHKYPPPLSLLSKQVDESLLDRETARTQVMRLLSQLMQIRAREREERARDMHQVAARQQEIAARQAALGETRTALEASMRDTAARKSVLLQTGIVPTTGWYERFNHLAVAAAPPSKLLSSEEAWRSTLRDAREVVRHQEEELTRLSTICVQEEEVFARTASSLQARVEWRDRGVSRMLAYWEKKAETVKTAYMAERMDRDAADKMLQLEAAHLGRRLEEGRQQFIETKELYRQLRRQAEGIVVRLQRKDTLDSVSRQIAETDRAIAAHQQRQPRRSAALT
ncbi:hypothetical protein JKF63_01596 [Porcisia hertigi]|uniref:SH3 domain-containing protein n=1 Tax=Porcisia hertigi TaxID=2761500 RepID=A0A836HLF2_9TRYP|nr:hypothetical protein JKF63_01596 [Porcisia hertigi]